MNDIRISPTLAEDIPALVTLVRNSFAPDLLPFMVYGQRGIEQYLADAMPREGFVTRRATWSAIDVATGSVVGFAEFDLGKQTAPHLSYVCVAPTHRGRGIAVKLMRLDEFAAAGCERMTLDVFRDNTNARALYSRLGFTDVGHSAWFARCLPQASSRELEVLNRPQSFAVHAAYDFSTLQIVWGNDEVVLGRLGDSCVRVPNTSRFSDEDFLGAVAFAFPDADSALLITDEPVNGLSGLSGGRCLVESVRMSVEL